MHIVLNTEQMREVDNYMIGTMHIPGIVLMENAARGVCDMIMDNTRPCVAHVFCGVGNNGGDGLAVARILLAHGYDVYVIVAGDSSRMTEDTATNFAMFGQLEKRVRCISSMEELRQWRIPRASVVVDALFGTGLAREVTGLYAELIGHINDCGQALVISVDMPSGISADTGAALGCAVQADATVTFQYPKYGHYLFPGREYTGQLAIARIGVDAGCETVGNAAAVAYESGDADISVPARRMNTNKGNYGRLLVVAGSVGMAGAATLAAGAASKAGAGLVTLGAVEEVVNIVQAAVPQATCKVLASENGQLARNSVFDIARIIKGKTALAIGPGLGTGPDIQALVENVLTDYAVTKVLDADAINALAGKKMLLHHKAGDVILTPHPREFANLTDQDIKTILADPVGAAVSFAKEYRVTLVLKGATTVIADADGRAYLICAGTPGMAKGGSGDVLTGLIAGFAAQGMEPPECALRGVYVAAMAGEAAAAELGEYAMTAMDEIGHIGKVLQSIERETAQGSGADMDEPAAYAEAEPPAAANEPEADAEVEAQAQPDDAAENTQQLEKTAEQAIAEIEEKEKTQEIKKDAIREMTGGEDSDNPTRRRIG